MRLTLMLGALLSLALVACGDTASSKMATEDQLTGGEWQVTSIGDEPVLENTQVTILFKEGKVSGSAGCNRYFSGYKLGESLEIGPIAGTKMACPGPAMEQEQRFFALLEKVSTVSLKADGVLNLGNATDGITATR